MCKRLCLAAIFATAVAFVLAPHSAVACIPFDYKAELAAIEKKLKMRSMPEAERADVRRLRDTAVEMNRLANELNDGDKTLARNQAVAEAMAKLKLKRIVSRAAPSSGGSVHTAVKGCG